MDSKRVTVDGIRLAYRSVGAGRPILLLHGNPDSSRSWDPIARALADGDAGRVVAPDFPGFGESEPFPEGADLGPTAMAGFWLRATDAFGFEEPAVIAVHDFGGPWLLPFVAEHPERVRAALILNTVFHRDYRWHGWARVWQTPILGEASMAVMNRFAMRLEMRRGCPRMTRTLADETYARMHATMKRTVLRVYRAYANPARLFADWEERLVETLSKLPGRVLWGDRDPYLPVRFADRFGVPVTHRAELGHWHHLVEPQPVIDALRELASTS